jgi:hypothetical protein
MTEHYDDMMRNRLNSHESPVPQDMFDNISGRLSAIDQSFDAAVNNHVANYASPVPEGMFDGIYDRMEAFDTQFDAAINNRLTNFESSVPADMWQRIMNEKEKRRPVFWWWAAALLLVSLGLGGGYYLNQQNTIAGNSKTDETKATVTSENSKVDNVSGTQPNNNGVEDEAATVPSQKPFNNHEETTSGNNLDASDGNTGKGFISSFTKNYKENKYKKNSDKYLANKNEDDFLTENGMVINGSSQYENSFLPNEDQQLALRQMIRSSFNKLLPIQLLQANLKTPVLPCPINGDEPRNDWYADVYASPMMVFKNVTDKIPGKNISTGMDSTLHKQVSFNAGINLVKNIGEHFLVKAGVQYNQVNEVFRNTRVNEIKLITTVTIRTVILAPGDTIYIRDTSVIQQIGTVTKQTQNLYKSWDIPLIVGYEFGGKDLRLNANVGLIANISSSYKGDMLLDTAQQIINIADYKTTGVYKTKVGLGLYAGLAVVKAIGDRTDLLIEPHARWNLNNTTTDAAWFKQKNIVAGISIGVRYKLNGKRQR